MRSKILLLVLTSLIVVTNNCKKADAPTSEAGPLRAVEGPAQEVQDKGNGIAINTEKSIVKWLGAKVTGQHNGTVKISSGTINIDGDKIVGGKITLDMKTIDDLDLSGEWEAKLEEHLKSDEFFDVEKYPTAEFVITQVGPVSADGKTEITGNLTIKETTKSIKFPASITFDANKKPSAANASFSINRQSWKITYPGKPDDLIKDDIVLDLNISL